MMLHAVIGSNDSLETLFERLERGLNEVQRRVGLLFGYSYTEEGPETEAHIWRELRSNSALIRLVDDRGIPARYLIVEAEPDTAPAILDALAGEFQFVSLSELRDEARKLMDRHPGALVRMALAAERPPDPATAELILRALRSSDAGLREAGVFAAALTRSPQFLSQLEHLYEQEADPSVRGVLAQAILNCGGGP